jgi:hypothetical protein
MLRASFHGNAPIPPPCIAPGEPVTVLCVFEEVVMSQQEEPLRSWQQIAEQLMKERGHDKNIVLAEELDRTLRAKFNRQRIMRASHEEKSAA